MTKKEIKERMAQPDGGFNRLYMLCSDVEHFWGNQMPLNACEEMGELMQCISKAERKDLAYCDLDEDTEELLQHMIEEMGDVIISIMALTHRYSIMTEEIMEYMLTKVTTEK